MAFADWLRENVAGARTAMNAQITRFRSRSFLEAVVAGCALVACADGEVSSGEKQKMMGYLRSSEQLSVFDTEEVIRIFQKYISSLEFDMTIGTGEVLKAVSGFRGKPEAQLIVRVCCAIAAADGNFDEDEKRAVRTLVSELGLEPADFQL